MGILLRLAHEERRCVIIVMHDLDIAPQSDEVWMMRDGVRKPTFIWYVDRDEVWMMRDGVLQKDS